MVPPEETATAPEQVAENILTPEQVTEVLARFAEGADFLRELSDQQGIYLREVFVPGKDGETRVYTYQRAGTFPGMSSAETAVNFVDLDAEGEESFAGNIARRDSETGEWVDLSK